MYSRTNQPEEPLMLSEYSESLVSVRGLRANRPRCTFSRSPGIATSDKSRTKSTFVSTLKGNYYNLYDAGN